MSNFADEMRIRMKYTKFLFILLLLQISNNISSQTICRGIVLDKLTNEPIIGAFISTNGVEKTQTITNKDGAFVLKVVPKTSIVISYLGYKKLSTHTDSTAVYYLQADVKSLGEVVVTAQEGRKLSTSSTIKRQAMDHLQPSSFSDILELLPGGRASNSTLTTPNVISLREVPISGSDYATSSLGTQFVIDGAPISMHANIQRLSGALDRTSTMRNFTNMGVDMRSIATDDIKEVEIVRGIPSVKYGDLTSGLVKITRQRGGNNLSARFKADMNSKLFYVGKGFENTDKRLSFNFSADYLDSQSDPRNVLENYKRITLSARMNKVFETRSHQISTTLNIDYGGSFDEDKVDEELNYGGVDKYSSKYQRYAALFDIELKPKNTQSWLRSLDFSTSASYENDRLERTRLVQLTSETPAALNNVTGESDVVFIYPYTYTGSQTVDGKPINVFMRANGTFSFPLKGVTNELLIGSDFQIDKNLGQGQMFNVLYPLYPGTLHRPRKYSDIPASHTLSFYVEETASKQLGRYNIDLSAGIRAQTALNLPNSYALHNKYYLDPRVNASLTLPSFNVLGQPFTFSLSAGVGLHTMFPTIDQLYPENEYIDFVEFSYYHEQRENRRMRLQTYVVDPRNPSLTAARNVKKEVRGDVSWAGNRLTLTYFHEDMTSGFRSMAVFQPYQYKLYSMASLSGSPLTTPPNIDDLAFTMRSRLQSYNVWANGSRTFKRGLEFTFSSARVPLFNTRLTITGAWFKTHYQNALPVQEKPSRIVNGKALNAVGIYKDDEGYIREMVNTNFTFDSSIPQIKLGVSLSFQCLWQTANQSMRKETIPQNYMNENGDILPYTATEQQDDALRYLVRVQSEQAFERQTVPFSMNINLKATKKLWNDQLMVALFVNKLWDAHPDYERNNMVIRRFVVPYFGLEMSVKL